MKIPTPTPWIDSRRECICSVYYGNPEPDCEVHGVDAYYGRYDSGWWGRIRIPAKPRRAKTTSAG